MSATKQPKREKFGDRIKAERLRLGLTQARCAEILGMSKRWVEQAEAGHEPPEITQEGALARLSELQPAE